MLCSDKFLYTVYIFWCSSKYTYLLVGEFCTVAEEPVIRMERGFSDELIACRKRNEFFYAQLRQTGNSACFFHTIFRIPAWSLACFCSEIFGKDFPRYRRPIRIIPVRDR